PRKTAGARHAGHQREGVDRGVAEYEREIGEMRRRKGQACLCVRLEAASRRLGCRHGGKPEESAQGFLILQRDAGARLVAFDEIEEILAESRAVGPFECLRRVLEPTLGGLRVVATLGGERK